jgi:hypothetical protein
MTGRAEFSVIAPFAQGTLDAVSTLQFDQPACAEDAEFSAALARGIQLWTV